MAQETLVLTLAPADGERFAARLEQGDFEFRAVPHARVSVRGEGVVATLYRSGKLVVQGARPGDFLERYLEGGPREAGPKAGEPGDDVVRVGSDETGKGDYFGPLVVCAVRLRPDERKGLLASGVADSKQLSDDTVRRLAPALQARLAHAVEVIEPEEYNRLHAATKNLNVLLADAHARAIRRVVEPGCDVLVDQFASEHLLQQRLAGLDVTLRQMPRAEREVAVAAASVVARGVFLDRLAALSEEYAIDLHKGAGEPVDRAARRFVALHGFETLGKVAKLHFKNTGKIPR